MPYKCSIFLAMCQVGWSGDRSDIYVAQSVMSTQGIPNSPMKSMLDWVESTISRLDQHLVKAIKMHPNPMCLLRNN